MAGRKAASTVIAEIKTVETIDDLRQYERDRRPAVAEAYKVKLASFREVEEIASAEKTRAKLAEVLPEGSVPEVIQVVEGGWVKGWTERNIRLCTGDIYSLEHHADLVEHLVKLYPGRIKVLR